MLERLWRKRNPSTLLVGKYTGAGNYGNYGDSSKTKSRAPVRSGSPIPGCAFRETLIWKDTSILMFTAALLTTVKTWKSLKVQRQTNG